MIPFVDLRAQYHSIKGEIDAAIGRTLESCQFALGAEVENFEKLFGEYCRTPHAMGVNSGTSALHLALLAAGIGPGDEVITVPFTFIATVSAIGYVGATPVFVDVDPTYYTMDPAQLEAKITPKTKAIMPVHLYGQMADMAPIMEIAKRHNLVVIEDAAQAHGAEYKGQRAGEIGAIGCFSFYPGKNLGAYGEGGAVVTADDAYAKHVRSLRDWGQEPKGIFIHKGYNYRLEGIQGAILGVKMKYIEKWTDARRANAAIYRELLGDVPSVVLPVEMPETRHVFHVYAARVKDREALRAALNAKQIQHGVHYPRPAHLQPAWQELGYKAGDFPVSEQLANEVVSLPMFPELTADQIKVVADAVREAVGHA